MQRKSWILIAMLIMLPFVQLGVSYYISVQTLIFLLALTLLSVKALLKVFFAGGGLVVLTLMILHLPYENYSDINHEILRTIRHFLCFIVLLTFLSQKSQEEYFNKSIEKIIVMISFGLLCFVVMQRISFQAGQLLYLPREFYILNEATLGTELNVRYNLRPSATFGEPSYLGFIASSLYVIVLIRFNDGAIKLTTIFLIWATILISATLSGLLTLMSLTSMVFYRKGIKLKWVVFTIILGAVFLFCLYTFEILSTRLIDRIVGLSDIEQDKSANARMLHPLALIAFVFENYPLGMSTESLSRFVGTFATSNLNNGFYMLFVNFGITAFIICSLIFVRIRKCPILSLYILLASMFNGTVLGFDKVAVMAMVILLVGLNRVRPLKHLKSIAGKNQWTSRRRLHNVESRVNNL